MKFGCMCTTYDFTPCTKYPIVLEKTKYRGIVALVVYVDVIMLTNNDDDEYYVACKTITLSSFVYIY